MNNMKILFISLGCDKNLVDSEHMLGLLVEHGFEITDSEEDAEVIVINTCCFIHDAKEESIQNILEMAKYRTAGSCKVLLVTGCMAERYRDEIIEEIPEVDAVLGTNSYDKILDAIQDVLGGDRFQEYADLKGLPKIDAQRVVTTGGHYEYLKIAEGCDKHCTYCIIPKLRGPYRSVPMEELIAEAKTMAEQGVRARSRCAGDNHLWYRSVRKAVSPPSVKRALQNSGALLDPDSVLLSGGHLSGTRSDDEGRAESLSLPGSADSACQR